MHLAEGSGRGNKGSEVGGLVGERRRRAGQEGLSDHGSDQQVHARPPELSLMLALGWRAVGRLLVVCFRPRTAEGVRLDGSPFSPFKIPRRGLCPALHSVKPAHQVFKIRTVLKVAIGVS